MKLSEEQIRCVKLMTPIGSLQQYDISSIRSLLTGACYAADSKSDDINYKIRNLESNIKQRIKDLDEEKEILLRHRNNLASIADAKRTLLSALKDAIAKELQPQESNITDLDFSPNNSAIADQRE